MKILPVDKIREADAYTIAHEPIASIDLMERAAHACAAWIYGHIPASRPVMVVAGTGNNGGDGLAIARMLAGQHYDVSVILTGSPDQLSPDCKANFERLPRPLIRDITLVKDPEDPGLAHISSSRGAVIIDALFGSGLTRPIEDFNDRIIRQINNSGAAIISIDVPSGLYIDKTVREKSDPAVVKATYTLTFAPPKLAFFFPENDPYVGEWTLLNIGLSEEFIRNVDVRDHMITAAEVKPILHTRRRYDHKGHYGHALLICGSTGKMGAAVLAARACLRSGAGLVTVCAPHAGTGILQTSVPEAMLAIGRDENVFSGIPNLDLYSAIGIGPGIGLAQDTQKAFKHLIQAGISLIIDADAINILGENKTWLSFLPKDCIFTPHPREFERLAGKTSDDFERNRLQREFSFRYSCYVVLKGAHTAITTPDGRCFFNTTGNPGMATGGSGDILTGIITGLRAQHYTPLESCILGTYLHGLSGDLAARERGYEALIAGDLADNLGTAFKTLYGEL
jgi:NAD(P)H-hydrate epimerase